MAGDPKLDLMKRENHYSDLDYPRLSENSNLPFFTIRNPKRFGPGGYGHFPRAKIVLLGRCI
jgi:hypothetical protein